ncbi:hypothetical protein D3C86_2048080 [compost metagenome]
MSEETFKFRIKKGNNGSRYLKCFPKILSQVDFMLIVLPKVFFMSFVDMMFMSA